METKQQIRTSLLAARKAVPKELRKQFSDVICRSLQTYFAGKKDVLKQHGVYGYAPLGAEVSLTGFYGWLLKEGILLAFPRVSGETMEFYRVASMRELEKGSFGILEPSATCRPAGFENAYCFVPGSVFDRTGNRYGYGKGYYDRYFAKHPGLYRMGIAYEMQVKSRIPAEEYDIKMHALATESDIYVFDTDKKEEI